MVYCSIINPPLNPPSLNNGKFLNFLKSRYPRFLAINKYLFLSFLACLSLLEYISDDSPKYEASSNAKSSTYLLKFESLGARASNLISYLGTELARSFPESE